MVTTLEMYVAYGFGELLTATTEAFKDFGSESRRKKVIRPVSCACTWKRGMIIVVSRRFIVSVRNVDLKLKLAAW